MLSIYEEIFGGEYPLMKKVAPFHINPESIYFGDVMVKREGYGDSELTPIVDKAYSHLILRSQLNVLRSLAICIEMKWFVILVRTEFYSYLY